MRNFFKKKPNPWLTLALVIALAIILTAWAFLRDAEAALFRNWTTIDPDEEYKVEVRTTNIRVYEWTPAFNEKVTCMLIASEKTTNTVCYDKSADGIEKHASKE